MSAKFNQIFDSMLQQQQIMTLFLMLYTLDIVQERTVYSDTNDIFSCIVSTFKVSPFTNQRS